MRRRVIGEGDGLGIAIAYPLIAGDGKCLCRDDTGIHRGGIQGVVSCLSAGEACRNGLAGTNVLIIVKGGNHNLRRAVVGGSAGVRDTRIGPVAVVLFGLGSPIDGKLLFGDAPGLACRRRHVIGVHRGTRRDGRIGSGAHVGAGVIGQSGVRNGNGRLNGITVVCRYRALRALCRHRADGVRRAVVHNGVNSGACARKAPSVHAHRLLGNRPTKGGRRHLVVGLIHQREGDGGCAYVISIT